ncbi:deoxynucleoside triphosphate triphosphohydrolase SAMHD1-like [Neolamprologus brichardi]|uniref:deoxynucleoside triphosphate triphosphohydrolase SAMHD1-like n=1 Tax=Neolamprologus brichardi TaxID=32507 RepID=UPI001643E001|nr:deoxynucleoside triphosphate triphosphohydrolase SAMHD1-like [Neolamprologus brichardi]
MENQRETKESKVFNDPIHGHIELHPLLVKIIDTPQFQRLRNIKQLGGVYFVYPGASHNRFEHSIGVAHLAGQLAKKLAELKESLISDQDVLCVQIAGLCHDLGHGPFSHFFDGMFMDKIQFIFFKWRHEKASIEMFKHLLDKNDLKKVMGEYGLKVDKDGTDLVFIEEMIENPQDKKPQNDAWPYKGREEKKSFLYEIVSNKKTGIDVDKFDYFARDCHHLGIPNSFDHQRFVMFARVCDVEEDRKKFKHICSRDKESANLYDIFQQRLSIHRRACQHKIKMAVEIMLKDALILVDDHPDFKIQNSKGGTFHISQANGDMEAYTKLTDHVFERILHYQEGRKESSSKEEMQKESDLEKAREILQRVMKRDLYRCVGQAKFKKKSEEEIKERLKNLVNDIQDDGKDRDEVNNVTLTYTMGNEKPITKKYSYDKKEPEKSEDVTLGYGMENVDPISKAYYYRKDSPDKGEPIPKSDVFSVLPDWFSDEMLRVYWKNPKELKDEDIKTKEEEFKEFFKDWCKDNGYKDLNKEVPSAGRATPGNE